MILPKHIFFQNIKIKSNSRTWMTLKSSIEIFQTLEPQRPQWPLQPQQPQWPQWPQQPHFTKFFIQLDGWTIPSTQMTSTSPFLWNGLSKIQFFTDIWYPFCRRLLRPAYVTFWKLVEETQISKPPEPARHEIMDPSTSQSWFTCDTSIWDTLYI